MKALNLLFILVILVSCQTVKKTTDENKLDEVIKAHFNGDVTTVVNTSETFFIIKQTNKTSEELPVNALNYSIYDVQKGTIVYTERKYNASVKWYNDLYVVIESRPGVKSLDEDIDNAMKHYYINVKTLEKLTQKPN
ncbi:hypothetical protein [Carboxylicivirga sp. N1Y90]|uniref:hypothetical protein n=1 Tax=Carboxylicivirga fragile TaxID=3417571 RepID=UPI003D332636|nr:hypothetical protein [Marinilabiliaceae bacterium N1Y90]